MTVHVPQSEIEVYAFGPYILSPERQSLVRGQMPVQIGGRALDILTLLVRRRGEIVTKGELFDHCWPNTYVHDANLKVNIASLRRLLGDGPDEPYIATVPGRGYRFVAPVMSQATDSVIGEIRVPAAARSHTLPPRPALIGRDGDLANLSSALAAFRCVSIVGPGGVGKTTIAIALAHAEAANFPDGACFIDLSTIGDPQYAIAAIAAGVGARQSTGEALGEVTDLLLGRRILIVLDNCEHVLPTVTAIADTLLQKLPGAKILVTSREPLRAVAEHVYRLPTLMVPPSPNATAKEALNFAAVRLFVTRARERGDYILTDADAPVISAICNRLDGIALAIELAASKAASLGATTLLAMLERRFLSMSNGQRDAPLRQQTLLATLDWSYRLLSDDEAALFRLLSVFAGAFRLRDAVGMARSIDFDEHKTVDALGRLVQKSIVAADYQEGAISYKLLDSTRAYASQRLAEIGQSDNAMRVYANHILALFEKAAEERAWRTKLDWMVEYAGRVDDVRNVLARAYREPEGLLLCIKLTAATISLWNELSAISEMHARIERALATARELPDCEPALIMKLIAARAAGMSYAQHITSTTEDAWRECHEMGVATGDVEHQLYGLWGLTAYLIFVGRPLEGIQNITAFMKIAEAEADWPAIAEGHRMMAMAEIYTGKIASARQRLEMLVERHQQPGEPVRFARFQSESSVHVRGSLAVALWISGEPVRALQVAGEAIDRAEATGHVVSQSNALAVSAIPIALWTGDIERAATFIAMLEKNLQRADVGLWREICLFFKSYLASMRGKAGAAAELRRHLEGMMAARHLLRAPMHYSMTAEAFLRDDDIVGARKLAWEALAMAESQDALWCMPEIMRICGLIELRCGNSEDGAGWLRRGIAVARYTNALTLELRLALALASDIGAAEARDVLQAACARYTDEVDFADLGQARALLHESMPAAGSRSGRA